MMKLAARPVPVFRHLNKLTDECSVKERAEPVDGQSSLGYYVDDAARALVVVCREPRPAPNVSGLARRYLDFVLSAVQPTGACHNRMSAGMWTDDAGIGDWWGRALWSLGVAATAAPTPALQAHALDGFRRAAQQRTPDLTATAFSALGAGEILVKNPADAVARSLLTDAVETLWWDDVDPEWVWPLPRLGYANAVLAEAMLLGGDLLTNNLAFSRGLEMLAFLLRTETRDTHLSVTPVGGRGPGDEQPPGDQCPVDVAAIGDACVTAYRITGERRWLDGIELAWRWFLGENDAATPMFDPATGAGYDALEQSGRTEAQGAASTLAMLSTAQHARRFASRG